jgi:hypothetical protein
MSENASDEQAPRDQGRTKKHEEQEVRVDAQEGGSGGGGPAPGIDRPCPPGDVPYSAAGERPAYRDTEGGSGGGGPAPGIDRDPGDAN